MSKTILSEVETDFTAVYKQPTRIKFPGATDTTYHAPVYVKALERQHLLEKQNKIKLNSRISDLESQIAYLKRDNDELREKHERVMMVFDRVPTV